MNNVIVENTLNKDANLFECKHRIDAALIAQTDSGEILYTTERSKSCAGTTATYTKSNNKLLIK